MSMRQSKALDYLLDAYRQIGKAIPLWTQGQGGNLSFKDISSNFLYIKPSGLRLDQVHTSNDLVRLDITSLNTNLKYLLESEYSEDQEVEYADYINIAKIDTTSKMRPSMETGFHVALMGAYTFHFHSIPAIIMGQLFSTGRVNFDDFESLGAFKNKIVVLDYATPGLQLSKKIRQHANKNIIILKNHGVILSSDSPEILNEWKTIEDEFLKQCLNQSQISILSNHNIDELASKEAPIVPFFPDFAVFLGRIKDCLIPPPLDSELWKFSAEFKSTKLDLYEIWMAHCLLHEVSPDLETLSGQEVQKLSKLPTEQFRMRNT